MSVSPQPAVQTIFEAVYQGKYHDEEGYTPTDAPEVALAAKHGGRILDIHPEVGCEER